MSCTSEVIKALTCHAEVYGMEDKKLPGLRVGSNVLFGSHGGRMAGAAASEEALALVQANMRA